MKNGFKKWLSEFAAGSVIIRTLDKLSDAIYKKLGSGAYSFAFGSYDTMCETFEESKLGESQNKKRGKLFTYISRSIEESIYIQSVSAFMKKLSLLSMRVIGTFIMSFGFFSLAAQMMVYLATRDEESLKSGIVSLAIMVLGLVLAFIKGSVSSIIYNSGFFGNFARKFCGFKERSFSIDAEPIGSMAIAAILGLPFGMLAFFINPLLILTLFVAIIGAYIVLLHPEFGYNTVILLLPFLVVLPHPSILLALLTIATFFSFIIKLIMGKRYFRLTLLDALVICFLGVLVLGGLVSYGGTQSIMAASIYAALALGYFLTVGIVNSKEALKRTVSILGTSLLLVSLYGLYQNFSGNISAEWIDTEMFDAIAGRVVSTFENPNMLGEYLILLLPIMAGAMLAPKDLFKKGSYFICFALGCACLVFTWARGAWLGFLFAAVVFMLIWNRKTMGVIIAGIVALPLIIPYLPQSIVSRFTSIGNLADTSTNYRVYIWRGSVNLAADYALSGIGIGEQAFDRVYPYYSFAGIEKAPHAHNLFLQLFIEVGIFGFIAFLALLICVMQSGFSLAKKGADKEVRLIGCGALCGLFAALVQGMTDYIWYNYRVYFVFWLVIGIISAAQRIDRAARIRKSSYDGLEGE